MKLATTWVSGLPFFRPLDRRLNLALTLRVLLTAAVTCSVVSSASLGAATIQILNADGAGEGFNDPSPRAPVVGNPGTTLGQQRLNAFAAAASYWAGRLSSQVPIAVYARMDPLPCTPTSGTLGAAGPTDAFVDFPGSTRAATAFPSALANALRGLDLDPATPEIQATFNSSVDSDPNCLTGLVWWYGVGATPPPGTESFYETVLHELAHGLGFLTFVNLETGERIEGFDDIYMTFLEDHSTGKSWPQMTNSQRANSAKDTSDLHWIGGTAVAAGSGLSNGRHPSGHIQMFAPSSLTPGSSVSHWDTALFPDEIMEPFATSSPADIVTTSLLKDLGWTSLQVGSCTRDSRTACLLNNRFEVRVTYNTGSQGGDAQVMSFNGARTESDQSVFFYFFDNVNFEMGVKMVNACTPPFNQYWAFVSGLTNVGYQVSIRDSVTGATKTYSNPLGTYPQTVGDTSALNCLVGGEPAGEPELLGILPAPEGADDEAGTEVASDLGLFDTARPAVELRASSGGRAVASGVASGAPLAWAGAGVSLHPEAPTEFGLDILGFSEWSIESGEIYIRADNVKNSRASTSGALGLALWASADPVTAEGLSGYSLGDCLGYPALAAGGTHPSLVCETAYQAPPSGCYHITILLLEQIDGLWYYVDWVTDGVTHPLNGGSCQPTGSCTPSATRACLLNDRFEVTVSYQTATAGGQASVMSFSGQRAESDQSVFLYFFDNANFEMGVKMVNACTPPFDRFWAFISGLTNQGYTVTIRDTATGVVKNYNNPLGTYPQTVGDTNAFLCQ